MRDISQIKLRSTQLHDTDQNATENSMKCLNFSWFLLLAVGCGKSVGQPADCNALSICVTNDPSNTICNSSTNATLSINEVRQFLLLSNSQTCITIYLTNEVHLLENVLSLNFVHIELFGPYTTELATIKCMNNSGIDFVAKNGFISVSDVVFKNCGRLRNIPTIEGFNPVALFFNQISYKLDHVTVLNSGSGVFAYKSKKQLINNCKFLNNNEGHLKIIDTYSLSIHGTLFHNGSSAQGAGIQMVTTYSAAVNITDSTFEKNIARNGSNFYFSSRNSGYFSSSHTIHIANCIFTQTLSQLDDSFGVMIHSQNSGLDPQIVNVTIIKSKFSDNKIGGVVIYNARSVLIKHCLFANNNGTGVQLTKAKNEWNEKTEELKLSITQAQFLHNVKALVLCIMLETYTDKAKTIIKDCLFAHNHFQPLNSKSLVPAAVYIQGNTGNYMKSAFDPRVMLYGYYENNMITIQDSIFENNGCIENSSSCSALYLHNADNVKIDNTSFTGNSGTGITLRGSFMTILNKLNLTQNHGVSGGAVYLEHTFLLNKKDNLPPLAKFSRIHFSSDAYLYANENIALGYGGAMYTDETCDYRDKKKYCFFQFESSDYASDYLSSRLNFMGNRAQLGGNAIFGGCLSNCYINSNITVDIRRPDNIFWKIVTSNGDASQSEFAEHPYRIVLCENSTSNINTNSVTCHNEKHDHIAVYRGEVFTVQMMAVGNSCSPSSNVIIAGVSTKHIHIGREQGIKQSNPYCDNYSFSLHSDIEDFNDLFIELTLTLKKEAPLLKNPTVTTLNVDFKNYCPPGFKLDQFHEKCICSNLITANGIVCNPDYSLQVPALTWIGIWRSHVAVGPYCQNCKVKEMMLDNVNKSENLCVSGRRGLICGECVDGYSVKLGRHKCGDCSKSNYNGILLTIGFAIAGFLLPFFLLRLNFTISTGLINGLIFYSNIVYANHEVFLPISRDYNKTRLDNVVNFLYIFQSWMNLDFGFDICYFPGTNTYIITWLQFAFPIYIWLLIFIIVVVSRYSTKVSKFTGHNTISVLATLLLLSYTKLLLAIISASSYTQLYLYNGKKSYPLWFSDANIRYLTGKHIGLFLMSTIMILTYILPFTLLVTLGPILQAYSNHKILKWIVKVKPFLDAFHGPYTTKYRYWPGLLLFLRLTLLTVFSFYSLGDESFKAAIIAVSTFSLFLLWLLLGKMNKNSIYRNRKLNTLELFFLSNLTLFAIILLYFKTQIAKGDSRQQVLAVVMVGSVFIVFGSILVYHFFCTVKKWRIARKIASALSCNKKEEQGGKEDDDHQELLRNDSIITYENEPATQSIIEISDHLKRKGLENFREPLLGSRACDTNYTNYNAFGQHI